MSNLTTALLCALVYYGVFVLDEAFSWQALTRPIVYGPIVGLVLGDLYTGCVMDIVLLSASRARATSLLIATSPLVPMPSIPSSKRSERSRQGLVAYQ